jgi:hypothetical protein
MTPTETLIGLVMFGAFLAMICARAPMPKRRDRRGAGAKLRAALDSENVIEP